MGAAIKQNCGTKGNQNYNSTKILCIPRVEESKGKEKECTGNREGRGGVSIREEANIFKRGGHGDG